MLKNNSLMHQFVKPWLAGELSVLLALEKIFSGSELTPSHISLFFLSLVFSSLQFSSPIFSKPVLPSNYCSFILPELQTASFIFRKKSFREK